MRKVPADLHRWLPAVGLVLLALVGEAVEAKKCGKTTSIWTGKAISRTRHFLLYSINQYLTKGYY